MRFTDKPLSFLIDDILKSSNQSTHHTYPIINKSLCSNRNFEQGKFSSCHSNSSHHCHLSILQSDSMYSNFIHHRRCRRTRTVFSDAQLISLEKRFETQKYLSTSDRIELADMLHLSQLQIKTWYQNRRMKWKKQVMLDGFKEIPTKPKGRPKKNSIPSFAELQRLENEKQISTSIISSSCASDDDDEYTSQSTICSDDDDDGEEEEFIDIEQ
ncbi:unnamed protein product [Adineta steineri]|uniref:Homeobox domain-containing protein n=1 Tax=Adineta steineri TaxID=433720 RepID=A0A819T4R3_9BILA|nr:unnamed protein product [Adineta steineri]CAF4067004.1 unnamed protein product [Adineta steineri]